MNIEYRIIVNDSAFKIDESYEIEKDADESYEDYEKRAFKEFEQYKNFPRDEWESFELRKYDLDEDDYLDWDMTESKYYNGGQK